MKQNLCYNIYIDLERTIITCDYAQGNLEHEYEENIDS